MSESSLLPANWTLPKVFRDRLGAKVGRQRSMFHEGHLLLVLHAPPIADQPRREGRFFWRDPEGNWRSSETGNGVVALDALLLAYHAEIDKCDQREDKATRAEDYFTLLTELSPLHRAARNVHRVLQEARLQCPEDRRIIDFRDQAYQLERTAELLNSALKNGLDFAMARQAERQTQVSHQMSVAAHRLNVLAAFFFPVATLSAIFGVNIKHGLEDHASYLPFAAFLACGLLSGAILATFITRKPRE